MVSKRFNLVLKSKISSFNETINVDSDKSISIRSFLIGSISQNISQIENTLESEDVLSTIDCLKELGVKIVKQNKSPGHHTIQWDATNNQGYPVSAGVYFFNIVAGDFSKTKKVLLLK